MDLVERLQRLLEWEQEGFWLIVADCQILFVACDPLQTNAVLVRSNVLCQGVYWVPAGRSWICPHSYECGSTASSRQGLDKCQCHFQDGTREEMHSEDLNRCKSFQCVLGSDRQLGLLVQKWM